MPSIGTLYALLMGPVGTCNCRCAGLTSVKGDRTIIRLSPVLLRPVRQSASFELSQCRKRPPKQDTNVDSLLIPSCVPGDHEFAEHPAA